MTDRDTLQTLDQQLLKERNLQRATMIDHNLNRAKRLHEEFLANLASLQEEIKQKTAQHIAEDPHVIGWTIKCLKLIDNCMLASSSDGKNKSFQIQIIEGEWPSDLREIDIALFNSRPILDLDRKTVMEAYYKDIELLSINYKNKLGHKDLPYIPVRVKIGDLSASAKASLITMADDILITVTLSKELLKST